MTAIRVTVSSSIANRGPSRPTPESLVPPYGMTSERNPGTSLTTTPPTSSRSTAANAVSSDPVKTLGVQAVAGGVDRLERRVEVGHRAHDDDRAEDLLVPGGAAVGHVEQHGRREHAVAAPSAAGQQPAPAATAPLDPVEHAGGGPRVDQRRDPGVRVARVADDDLADPRRPAA